VAYPRARVLVTKSLVVNGAPMPMPFWLRARDSDPKLNGIGLDFPVSYGL
jgi:hypothetical protein